jgi:hypothetical protein
MSSSVEIRFIPIYFKSSKAGKMLSLLLRIHALEKDILLTLNHSFGAFRVNTRWVASEGMFSKYL